MILPTIGASRLALKGLFAAAPWIAFGVLIAAVFVQRQQIVVRDTRLKAQAVLIMRYTEVMRVTRVRIESASAASTAAARTRATRIDTANRQLKKDADHALVPALADARAAAARYVVAHRLRDAPARATTADRGRAGPGTDPEGRADPGQPGRAGAAPLVAAAHDATVAVSAADIGICTDNTVRLVNARDWALKLEGVK